MGKMKYKISSRAAILLGRESVSKVDGAIIELVKNTYDADAILCFICFDIENDNIYILDNGIGMTKETIENYWMTIGTDNKRENYKSEKNRIKSGEKGIGRFALDRLGSKCEMYTKNKISEKVILWKNDWESFEQPGKTIDEIEAEFYYLETTFENIVPKPILEDINKINEKIKQENTFISLESGTLFKISKLRDIWDEKEIFDIVNSMGFLIPPNENKEYMIYMKKSLNEDYIEVENEITYEYDYKMYVDFDGEKFEVKLVRNEFDLNRIPSEIFQMERFKKSPYTYSDFEKQEFVYDFSIPQLMKNENKDFIETIKKIGKFKFNYTFMKISSDVTAKESFYYKEMSKKRKLWLDQNSGIKIYRDNFLVRPYGDMNSDSFDWLGLDARMAKNPASISHPSGSWHVRNSQSQGVILISRVNNEEIIDKSSREGIIENEYFRLLKDVIKNLISIFEQDRAYIGRTMKLYKDEKNKKEKTKEEGKNIAKTILRRKNKKVQSNTEQVKTLAETVKIYEEEREELITEIKQLRSLATNGLITTSIVHDLKSINALLVNRVDSIETALDLNNEMLINRNLNDLRKNDIFLKSWITVITNQTKKDKRTRLKKNFYTVIHDTIAVLEPILTQKKIKVKITGDNKQTFKRIFVSDFESILYNLIINSIESFEKSRITERIINISLKTDEDFIIDYKDNGKGLGEVFKDPYDMFTFGTTSKYDVNGKQIGTGLGMYIVASTIREYNGKYSITEYKSGFGLEMRFPI